MSNPFTRRCTHKSLKKTGCPNCGREFLYCPVCHPNQIVCSLCVQVHWTPIADQGKIYKVQVGDKRIVLTRKEVTKTKARNSLRNYVREHQEEINKKAREKYASDPEIRNRNREKQRDFRFRRRETGIPGEEERKARISLSKKVCYLLKHDQYAARQAAYRASHQEEIKAKTREYLEKNREKKRIRDREYYSAHKEQIKQKRKKRYKAGK